MKKFLSTREVAGFLNVNEKMVYTLVSEKGLPAAKVTGKWLFPRHLVEQWVEIHTMNYPDAGYAVPAKTHLLVIAGSNDPLLDKTIHMFNAEYSGRLPEYLAVFGNLGSMGGLNALRKNLCHIASSHLVQENGDEYNFDFAVRELEQAPVVVNFAWREQGIVLAGTNPKNIKTLPDLGQAGITIVNRPVGTGTRLLFDTEMGKAGIRSERISGYDNEAGRHIDVGIEVLSGRADAGIAIRPTAALLGLSFIPLKWERYDFLIRKERFFDPDIQTFLGMLDDSEFQKTADGLSGYDLSQSGKMVFPGNQKTTAR